MQRPVHQLALTIVAYVSAAVLAVGSLLHAFVNAREVFSPAITFVGFAATIADLDNRRHMGAAQANALGDRRWSTHTNSPAWIQGPLHLRWRTPSSLDPPNHPVCWSPVHGANNEIRS